MKIDDFTDEEFIESIKILAAPYKKKGSNECLSSIEINEIQRTDAFLCITTTQMFSNEYLLNRIYKFSNDKNEKIKIEIIERGENDEIIDISESVRPFLTMVTKSDILKGKDWLSRLNYDDYMYFINKFYAKCSSLTFESNEQSPEHCRWVSLNDEEGYYMGITIVFGDYGIGYNHYGKLSKLNKRTVFDSESLEFYYAIVNKLNNCDKIEYTNKFIETTLLAYQNVNSGKLYFDEEMKNAENVAKKLIYEVTGNLENCKSLKLEDVVS